MSMDKAKSPAAKNQPVAKKPTPAAPAASAPTGPVPPLFRKIDWLTFGLTLVLVFIGYLLTISPDLTLEDSGELATGSFYAGVPHPPGYPVWTIYTWLFTRLLPFSNIAFRVSVGCAFSGALASALLALAVSRGSSMIIEGIASLKTLERKWENALCVVSGFVAGTMIGFNGYMWSQSVIVEVYPFSVVSLMGVMLCLMRWIYAPHQRRYLYWAMFLFGICFTNHQTLIVAAMGIEVLIIAGSPKLGRDFLISNSICYIIGLILKSKGYITTWDSAPKEFNMVFVIFNMVGLASIAGALWLIIQTQKVLTEWKPVVISGIVALAGAAFYFYMPLAGMSDPPMQWGYPRTVEGFQHALTRGQYEKTNPTNFLTDPFRLVSQIGMLFGGVTDEFNWVNALIALVPFIFFIKMQRRERAWLIGIVATYLCLGVLLLILLNPPPDRQARELIRVFFTASHVMVAMCFGYGLTLISAFLFTNAQACRKWLPLGFFLAVAAALGTLFTLVFEQHGSGIPAEGLGTAYFGCVAAIAGLMLLLKYESDKFATLACGIGMIALGLANALFGLKDVIKLKTNVPHCISIFFNGLGDTFTHGDSTTKIYGGLFVLLVVIAFCAVVLFNSAKKQAAILFLILLTPIYSVSTHWFDNEQLHHYFGYWFGHDMFTPPFVGTDGKLSYDAKLREQMMKDPEKAKLIYPEMDRDTVLFGGTDPGRFCPTYMIFCESFTPANCKPRDPAFDRRDVYIITQNALADGTYLQYIRAHYNRSTEVDVPFFSELTRSAKERKLNYETNTIARVAGTLLDRPFEALGDNIEKQRRVGESFFKDKDFTDIKSLATKLQGGDAVSKFIRENLSKQTQDLLTKPEGSGLAKSLAKDLNNLIEREVAPRRELTRRTQARQSPDSTASTKLQENINKLSFYNTNRFSGVQLSEKLQRFIVQDPQSHTRVRLNRLLLEHLYPKEIAKSPGGVYPDLEIFTPTPEESQQCFNEYLVDAQKRLSHDMQFPSEPRQIQPGEDVRYVTVNGEQRVTVSGQIAVMAINGLLTKVIFDKNPKHEFYVEESFPLAWMYPYLTPYGVIMKINREKLPELTDDIIKKDHEFWSRYAERLIGTNVVTYDTPVADIAKFCEKVYLEHDFTGYKGERKFVRDDQGQKAFSKLRSSIGGIYNWRIEQANKQLIKLQEKPPAERAQAEIMRLTILRDKMFKEADFTFRQAFAFCPYSPEAVFRYAQLLISVGRIEDAYTVASTCLKLDPYNGSVIGLVENLKQARRPQQNPLSQMEQEYRQQPDNFQAAFNLASAYIQMGQTNRVIEVFDKVLANPKVNLEATLFIARAYADMQVYPKLEKALERLVQISPDSAEAWYDLAALRAGLTAQNPGKTSDAIKALQKALELSSRRLAKNPKESNLLARLSADAAFNPLRQDSNFLKIANAK